MPVLKSYTHPWIHTSWPMGVPLVHAWTIVSNLARCSTCTLTFSSTTIARAFLSAEESPSLWVNLVRGSSQRLRGWSAACVPTVAMGLWVNEDAALAAPRHAAAPPHSVWPTIETEEGVSQLAGNPTEISHCAERLHSRPHMSRQLLCWHRPDGIGCKTASVKLLLVKYICTHLATFLCTKRSPGFEPVTTDSGTLESEHPIQRV